MTQSSTLVFALDLAGLLIWDSAWAHTDQLCCSLLDFSVFPPLFFFILILFTPPLLHFRCVYSRANWAGITPVLSFLLLSFFSYLLCFPPSSSQELCEICFLLAFENVTAWFKMFSYSWIMDHWVKKKHIEAVPERLLLVGLTIT